MVRGSVCLKLKLLLIIKLKLDIFIVIVTMISSNEIKEEGMLKCSNCAFYLPFRSDGYNCGYLIKRVEDCRPGCKYFSSLLTEQKDIVQSSL
jgi:hypothetical protein